MRIYWLFVEAICFISMCATVWWCATEPSPLLAGLDCALAFWNAAFIQYARVMRHKLPAPARSHEIVLRFSRTVLIK